MSLRGVNSAFVKIKKSKLREVKKVFYLACEGKKTEIYYFKMIENKKQELKISNNIKIEPYFQEHNNPVALLEYLKNKKKNNDLDDDEFFLVIDRDSKNFTEEQFEKVITECPNEKIGVALTNPCFELWLLLHFKKIKKKDAHTLSNGDCGEILKEELVKELQKLNPKIKTYSKDGIKALFPYFQGNIKNAIENAGLLENNNEKLKENVGTSAGLLMEKIINI